jgi:hypothetical protein
MEEEAAGSTDGGGDFRRRSGEDGAAGGSDGFYMVLTYFRETNVEALRIRERLKRAIERAKAEMAHDCFEAFEEAQDVIHGEVLQAARRADAIERVRRMDAKTEAWYARELVEVKNSWDDLNRLWSMALRGEEPLAELVRRSEQSLEILDQLAYLCACQTIPDELTNYLANYRIGTCLDFISTFRDQLPDEAYTRKVLETLAPQSELVPGLVDVRNAKVIKADRRAWRQMMSVLAVLVTVALGFGLIALAVEFGNWLQFKPEDWPLNNKNWAMVNGGYVLVLLGVLGHWILDRVKLNRSGGDATPFSEWLMWIHVNEVQIVMRIATVWLLLGLGLGFKTFSLANGLQPLAFFTGGYFMDSTFDALVGRFNTFIGGMDPDKKKDGKDKG